MAQGSSHLQGVEFTGEAYLAAAVERAGAVQRLYDDGQYGLAIYTAGVAVEALFRAYRTRIDPSFSSRHNLTELAKECRFAEHVPGRLFDEYTANLATVALRWNNAHRYRSGSVMLRYLNRNGLFKGIRGDVLKENARQVINSATDLVNLGVRRWKNSSNT